MTRIDGSRLGMIGRVTVGDTDLDPDVQPALRASSGNLPEAARHELERFTHQTRDGLLNHRSDRS